MATAPKTAQKVVPIETAPETESPSPKRGKKRYVIWFLALLLLGGGGGATAWYFMGETAQPDDGTASTPPPEPAKPPVFVALESFTVNLQQDGGIEQYLQTAFTLQVADQTQVDQIKLYMPLVRSRLLFLLSSKKASELSSLEGKKKLTEEIIAQVKQPFTPKGPAQAVSGVFFTSFVIQ